MDYTAIIITFMNYASMLLGIMFLLTFTVNIIVEVVKRLVPKVPTDIVVFVISIAITILALYITASIMVDPSTIFIDGTHIKASANKKKYQKEQVKKAAKVYSGQLRREVNAEREKLGKKPIEDDQDDDDPKPPTNGGTTEKTVSTTDPDSGMFVKGEHERQFAYEAHTACDSRGFVLGVEVTAGNVHDSVAWDKIYDDVTRRHNVQFVNPPITSVVCVADSITPTRAVWQIPSICTVKLWIFVSMVYPATSCWHSSCASPKYATPTRSIPRMFTSTFPRERGNADEKIDRVQRSTSYLRIADTLVPWR